MDIRLLERSSVRLRLNLNSGIVVPIGSLVRSNSTGNLFRLRDQAKNTGSVTGDIFVAAEAFSFGDIEAKAGTLTSIVNPLLGWNSTTNDNDATLPGDIDTSFGDLILTTGSEEIKQNIRIRLRFFQGEWFLNTDIGIPYFRSFFIKNPNLALIRSIIREAVEGVPKIQSVTKVNTEIMTGSRELKVNIEATTDLNEILQFEDILIFG